MRGRDWYIVQVQSGTEELTCKRIVDESAVIDRLQAEAAEEKLMAVVENAQLGASPLVAHELQRAVGSATPDCIPHLLDECFSPRFRTQKKLHGQWVNIEHSLMPGYVVAVTDDPWELQRRLRAMPVIAHVVGTPNATGESMTYLPLSAEERQWVETYTTEGNRVVPMSMAYKEGDRLVVTDGPLVGQEGRIVRVKRSASLAFLEFRVGQLRIKTTVGLGIVTRKGSETTE